MPSQYLYMFLDEAGDFNFSVSGTKFFMITAITKARPFFLDDPITSLKYDLIEGVLILNTFMPLRIDRRFVIRCLQSFRII